MMIVPIFDYDATLVTDEDTPSKKSVLDLVDSIKSVYNVPLIILTAGSVNETDDEELSPVKYADRPLTFFQGECELDVSINKINLNADVCIFGVLMSSEGVEDPSVYENIIGGMYNPVFNIGMFYYKVLDVERVKKISVMYHLLTQAGVNPHIVFVDDMYFHDMSGLDNMIVDPFEQTISSYFQIKPLETERDATMRLFDMADSIKANTFFDYLGTNSINVWNRYLLL